MIIGNSLTQVTLMNWYTTATLLNGRKSVYVCVRVRSNTMTKFYISEN